MACARYTLEHQSDVREKLEVTSLNFIYYNYSNFPVNTMNSRYLSQSIEINGLLLDMVPLITNPKSCLYLKVAFSKKVALRERQNGAEKVLLAPQSKNDYDKYLKHLLVESFY